MVDGAIRIIVVDPSGAVIVGAQDGEPVTRRQRRRQRNHSTPGPTERRAFASLDSGRYTIRVESPGFETCERCATCGCGSGDNRREVKLAIARLAETVDVGRDPRERGADPRSDAFATVLGPDAINELPDDPDEMERVLNDMAGPGAVMRVNGFRGGKLPPKDQIAQIRFHRNMFAADTHEPGFMSIDIITKPGLENWRGATNIGVRDAALDARNPFAPEKGDEHFRRLAFSLSGPLWKKRTSLALSADTVDAFDSKTIVAALPTGYFADSVRKPTTTLNWSARLEHALSPTQILRVEGQRNHNRLDNQGVGDYDLFDRAYRQAGDEALARGSVAGSIRKSLYNELRFQWRSLIHLVHAGEPGAGGNGVERLQLRWRADWRASRTPTKPSWRTTWTSLPENTRCAPDFRSTAAATAPTWRETQAAPSPSPASTPSMPGSRRRSRGMSAIRTWRCRSGRARSTFRTITACAGS